MRSPSRTTLSALLLALAACRGATGSAPADPAPTAGASAVAAGNAVTPVPIPPALLELKGTAAFAAAGPGAVPLAGGAETTIEPLATFRVELPVALADARLSLLDGGDAMVPGAGARQVGQATVLTLTPASPLAAGARLRLRVDGATSRELRAADGRRFTPLEWPLVVAGEPEPRKAAVRKGKRR